MNRFLARQQIGNLDQRVELQQEQNTPDGQGGFNTEWVSVDTVWADVRPMSGRERGHADRVQAEASYMVLIRRRGDVDESWRVKWLDRGRLMNITFVPDAGQRPLYLPLECERGVATGGA